ncbi:hypothetical protein PQQ63_15400 [Paraburkholderia metrosideri]|uniref:Uncharacterized protein n=1 Tax=Paraburkholderia metrosideri TaxID=580937 RepID=A0ABW9DVU2_9BURK
MSDTQQQVTIYEEAAGNACPYFYVLDGIVNQFQTLAAAEAAAASAGVTVQIAPIMGS